MGKIANVLFPLPALLGHPFGAKQPAQPGSMTAQSATPGQDTFATAATAQKKTPMDIRPFGEPPDFSALAAGGSNAMKLYGGI